VRLGGISDGACLRQQLLDVRVVGLIHARWVHYIIDPAKSAAL
jgi:hypothetical protein